MANKVPGEADAASLGTTVCEPCLELSLQPRPLENLAVGRTLSTFLCLAGVDPSFREIPLRKII